MEYTLNNINEFFGTLQMSVIYLWRKHLVTDKYSKHMALDEFYKEMPEMVDKLIEDWIGENDEINNFENILDGEKLNTLEYLETLKDICEEGREKFLKDSPALESDIDDIISFIDGIIYKVRELTENKRMTLRRLIESELIAEGNINNVERKWREFCGICYVYNVNPEEVEIELSPKKNWRVYVNGYKKFLVSRNILDEKVIEDKKIKIRK